MFQCTGPKLGTTSAEVSHFFWLQPTFQSNVLRNEATGYICKETLSLPTHEGLSHKWRKAYKETSQKKTKKHHPAFNCSAINILEFWGFLPENKVTCLRCRNPWCLQLQLSKPFSISPKKRLSVLRTHADEVSACNCWIYVAQEQRSATQNLAKHHHWCLFSKDMRWWNQYSKLPWTLATRRFLQSILLLLCFAPNCTPTDAPSLAGASLRCYFSAGQDKDSLSSWRTFILLLVERLFSRVLKAHPKQMP